MSRLAGVTADSLDFVVIGAQKAGTTTLWELLRRRPDVWVPPAKELLYFSHEDVYRQGLEHVLKRHGAPDDDRLRGTVTPHYMHGWQHMTTARIAARMAADLPRLTIVALLRDPVQRALAQYAMARARGRDLRSLDEAIEAELEPGALRRGRTCAGDTNTYVVQGEYGRILSEYRSVFPPEQVHVELTTQLANDPDGVLRRILSFLGARTEGLPAQPRLRLFAGGGEARASEDGCVELSNRLATAPGDQRSALAAEWARAQPQLTEQDAKSLRWVVERFAGLSTPLSPADHRGLRFELSKVWNVRPGPPRILRDDLHERMVNHYAPDAVRLRALMDIAVDW